MNHVARDHRSTPHSCGQQSERTADLESAEHAGLLLVCHSDMCIHELASRAVPLYSVTVATVATVVPEPFF
jgi:hypothetical protein